LKKSPNRRFKKFDRHTAKCEAVLQKTSKGSAKGRKALSSGLQKRKRIAPSTGRETNEKAEWPGYYFVAKTGLVKK